MAPLETAWASGGGGIRTHETAQHGLAVFKAAEVSLQNAIPAVLRASVRAIRASCPDASSTAPTDDSLKLGGQTSNTPASAAVAVVGPGKGWTSTWP